MKCNYGFIEEKKEYIQVKGCLSEYFWQRSVKVEGLACR